MQMKEWLRRILAFFFPERCILCGRLGKVNADCLCAHCETEPTERVYRFFSVRDRRNVYTLECRATMRYKEPFRSTLHRFKFRDETHLAEPLAKQMMLGMDSTKEYDCIVPVPISRARFKQRGYNQSALLAKALSAKTGIPYAEKLSKEKDNRIQHRLSAKEREKNVHGVYRAEACTSLRVLLIDDIVTTGATARECARMLYRAGAEDVGVLCCALVL